MSTRPDLLEHALAGDIFETEATPPQAPARESIAWNPDRFGEEQIRSLVRQVFLPGWPKPARQVVFCAVEDGDVAGVCLRVGQTIAAQVPGNVALVEAHLQSDEENEDYGTPVPVFRSAGFRPLRDTARVRIRGDHSTGLEGILAQSRRQLTAAISFLIDRPHLAAQMGVAGRALVACQHSPESHYVAMTHLYEQLAPRPKKVDDRGLKSVAKPVSGRVDRRPRRDFKIQRSGNLL